MYKRFTEAQFYKRSICITDAFYVNQGAFPGNLKEGMENKSFRGADRGEIFFGPYFCKKH